MGCVVGIWFLADALKYPLHIDRYVFSTYLETPWRVFVGRWLANAGCTVEDAPRGDWEVDLSPALQKRWRRQRVRLVFDPARTADGKTKVKVWQGVGFMLD